MRKLFLKRIRRKAIEIVNAALMHGIQYTIYRYTDLPDDIRQLMWRKCVDGFRDVNATSAAKQDMTENEFVKDSLNADVYKYVVSRVERDVAEPVGMLLVHKSIGTVPWVNARRFQGMFPYVLKSPRYFYISTLVVDRGHRGMAGSGLLVKAVIRDLYNLKGSTREDTGAAFIDYALVNRRLPGMVKFLANTASEEKQPLPVECSELGRHSYYLSSPGHTLAKYEVLRNIDSQHWLKWKHVHMRDDPRDPARTNFVDESFMNLLSDKSVIKVSNGGALWLLASDVSRVPFASPEFYKKWTNNRPLMYLLNIGSYPLELIEEGLKIAAQVSASTSSMLAFDMSEETMRSLRGISEVLQDVTIIDSQTYVAIVPRTLSDAGN